MTLTKKTPDTSGLVKKADYDAKINEIKGKIPSITGLAATSALNFVKNEIPNVSDLVKKTDCDAKTSDIESKYFTTSDYNKSTNTILDAKIKEKKLVKIQIFLDLQIILI